MVVREVEEIDLCERFIAVAGGGDAVGENYNLGFDWKGVSNVCGRQELASCHPECDNFDGGGGMDASTRVGVVEGVVGTIKNTVRVKEIKNGLKEN